ncbi:asparaginase [Paenibacillus crassostreae]|uniref:L-asparaginase n=1 Tax=Paenibacillus crassostreae TaxID=1763538 RepID=A0A167ANW3_9BACL|nr:asparaginase [Paenibacillus crassostreae]AOZ93722.1 L-asparaginase [Paenibacillus crassostreae]OAB71257.1 L-asparaginase [Paenibacillus crassostreae]
MSEAIQVIRGHYVESTHHIHIAVVDYTGKLLYSYGDPTRLTFARSAMKPFQAVPIIETGTARAFEYNASEIALSCASHSGEPIHRETVLNILSRAKLDESDLQCGTHVPKDKASYIELLKAGKELTPVYSNCSGKHSSMLATAVHLHEDIHTYPDINHPVQQRILDVIAEVCNVPREQIGLSVDGCGLPVHQIPLYNVALGFARLAHPEGTVSAAREEALETIRDAMMAHPVMVSGHKRFDTDVMSAYKGNIVSKMGAEGVQCIGIIDRGIGIAIKTEDGTDRASGVAAMDVLRQLGVTDESSTELLKDYIQAPVLNARKVKIGVVQANFVLNPATK